MKVEIREAVQGDYEALTGHPLPYRAKAWTVVRGAEILGVGGLMFMPGKIGAFVEMPETSRKYAVSLHRAGKLVVKEMERLRLPVVVALAKEDVVQARRWLSALGFKPELVNGQEVWLWRTP